MNDDSAVLAIGNDTWPFPIPLVRDEQGWRFDTATGTEELLDRRIGRNELHAIAVLRALVEARHKYAIEDRTRYVNIIFWIRFGALRSQLLRQLNDCCP